MAKSPSITIIEQDKSTYTVTSSATVLAVVGYATKGPIGEATLTTSLQDFETKFGSAPTNSPFAYLAVKKAFTQGNQIIFYRVADTTAGSSTEAIAAEGAELNTVAATAGYGEIQIDNSHDEYDASGLAAETWYSFEVEGTEYEFETGTATPTYSDIVTAMNSATQLADDTATLYSDGYTASWNSTNGYIRVTNQTTGTGTGVSITDTTNGAGTAQVVEVAFTDDSGNSNVNLSGKYVDFYIEDEPHRYWFNVTDGNSTSPGTPTGGYIYQVDILAADGNINVGGKFHAEVNANPGLSSVDGEAGTVTVTHAMAKDEPDAVENSTVIALTETAAGVNPDISNALTDFYAFDADTDTGSDADSSTTDHVLFKALQKGSATNNIKIHKTSFTSPVDGTTSHKIEVLYEGEIVETFTDLSLDEDDDNFFATVINADSDNGGSEWVEIEYEDVDADTVITFPDHDDDEYLTLGSGDDEYQTDDEIGDYDYRVGTDGIPTVTATEETLFTTALATTADLANADEYNYHILITPDMGGNVATQNAAISLANYRKDFIYIVDPPFGLTYDQVKDWHNGDGNGRTAAINNSYAAMYWSWLKTYNSAAGEYIWVPPSVFLAAKYMEVDRTWGPWYAPAGDARGRLNAADYEKSPSFAQREQLYGDLNAVNPIVNFTGKGLLIYGQKTLYRANSALNRVNVRRMIIYAKKLIKSAMESMVFEPHNPDSWRRAQGMITAILEPIRQEGGIDQYKVVIDSTTNTPDVISQNIMKGTIKIIPVNTIEIIELTLQVYKSGASLD